MGKKKSRKVQPDEFFSKGPLSVARFGKNVVFQSNWTDGAFAEMQKRLIGDYPEVVQEIDELVAEIAQQVAKLPAKQLLHRAWWEMAQLHMWVESEVQISTDESVSIRMIDYLQSMIAAVPPAANQREEISDEAWVSLRVCLEKNGLIS